MNNKSKKIKITCPYGDPIMRQTPNELGVWGDCKFFFNDSISECDYWFVIDNLIQEEKVLCNRENVFIFTLESPTIRTEINPDFLNQFSTVITYSRKLEHSKVIESISPSPWHLGVDNTNSETQKNGYKSYEDLSSSLSDRKTKLMSVISSNKNWTDGHRKRLEFVEALKNHYGDNIDVFGRGIKGFADKWDVIVPYKYHIALENSACFNGISEKLYDAFLGESFPIYYGSPNVRDYFSESSFLNIDINNIGESIKKIDSLILNNTYEKSIDYIKESKELVLNKYNLFALISTLCENDIESSSDGIHNVRELICLYPESKFTGEDIDIPNFKGRIKFYVRNFLSFFS